MLDWRFADQLRSDHEVEPWSPTHETAYIKFLGSGNRAKFIRRLREDDQYEEPDEGWTIEQNEDYLFDWCADLFKTETRAYSRLQALQGCEIPKLFLTMTLSLSVTGYEDATTLPQDLLNIDGLLLEYIDGPSLSELMTSPTFSRGDWQDIINQAICVVHKVSDHDILNEDVRPTNIIASPIDKSTVSGLKHNCRVVMIDFAICKFRGSE